MEKAVQTGNIPGLNLAAAPVDESTKLALKVAVGLLVVVGVTAGAATTPAESQPRPACPKLRCRWLACRINFLMKTFRPA